jgi:alkaline phosphatase D
VATELVGTSITSGGDGVDLSERNAAILAENPHVRFHNGQRGYVSCELEGDRLTAHYRIVPYVSQPDAPLVTRASFVVEDGRPGAQPA